MNLKKMPINEATDFKYTLDQQARRTLQSLSKKLLRQAVNEDSKIFRTHKMPKG